MRFGAQQRLTCPYRSACSVHRDPPPPSLCLVPMNQVELDHARLAMVAVLMSGVVGAGAGAGAGVYLNAHDGFSAVS